jgi:two-component system, OmpR family, sensor kinase
MSAGSESAAAGVPARPDRRGLLAGLGRWLAGRTLRSRLIAGLLALLALACAVVGLVTYLALRGFLLGQLDHQVAEASQRYTGCLTGPDHDAPAGDEPGGPGGPGGGPRPGSPATCARQQAAGTFTSAVRGGAVYDQAVADGTCKLSAGDSALLTTMPANGRPYTRTLAYLGSYRLVAVPGGSHRSYISGLPLSPVDGTLRQVELTEAAVFSAVLLLTGVIGTGWVRLSLRPLRRVAATAAEVTGLPLASGAVELPHRVPVTDQRTEVGQLGTAFNRMLGHVESALARRQASEARLRSFAADASHELRTPLAAIRGYAELARRAGGDLPADVQHALTRVESQAARMSALVEDLLLLARLDAGRPLETGLADLSRLAVEATSDAQAAGPGHRWLLELPGEAVVVPGDEQRLHQVLANLLSNARTHTPPGTKVTVALAPGADGGAWLCVTDDGPGIPGELRASLFERFVRGDTSRSRAAGSTGLGLAIVQAVVVAHGGTVTAASEPGQTRFTITLPGR